MDARELREFLEAYGFTVESFAEILGYPPLAVKGWLADQAMVPRVVASWTRLYEELHEARAQIERPLPPGV